MERLIVKNFGPIKNVEIELTKYVVFIGDTSTGKSVLGKLITIFREIFENLKSDHFNGPYTDFFDSLELTTQLSNYNILFDLTDSEIIYLNDDVKIYFFSNAFSYELYNQELRTKENIIKVLGNDFDAVQIKYFNSIFGRKSIYFPPERLLLSSLGNTISALWANEIDLPICFKKFASLYNVARKANQSIDFHEFGFTYKNLKDKEYVTNKNNDIELSKASSGIQSLIPLLIVSHNENKLQVFKNSSNFLLEEPELNLYPIKQKLVVEHFAQIVNSDEHNIVITTHSPYVLSVLDTLILAKNTVNENPKSSQYVNEIISELKWIDFSTISVYEVNEDGTITSIKNQEFKCIDANAIDRVSDIISNDYEKLIDLRYARQ